MRLRRNGGIILPINVCTIRQPPVALFKQKVGLECGEALLHMTCLSAVFEECVNILDLISRQRPVTYHLILRTWHEISLARNTSIRRIFSRNCVRENVCILTSNVVDRVPDYNGVIRNGCIIGMLSCDPYMKRSVKLIGVLLDQCATRK